MKKWREHFNFKSMSEERFKKEHDEEYLEEAGQ